jgi:hypothetical protein
VARASRPWKNKTRPRWPRHGTASRCHYKQDRLCETKPNLEKVGYLGYGSGVTYGAGLESRSKLRRLSHRTQSDTPWGRGHCS